MPHNIKIPGRLCTYFYISNIIVGSDNERSKAGFDVVIPYNVSCLHSVQLLSSSILINFNDLISHMPSFVGTAIQ